MKWRGSKGENVSGFFGGTFCGFFFLASGFVYFGLFLLGWGWVFFGGVLFFYVFFFIFYFYFFKLGCFVFLGGGMGVDKKINNYEQLFQISTSHFIKKYVKNHNKIK